MKPDLVGEVEVMIVLDTNVVSELVRAAPEPAVLAPSYDFCPGRWRDTPGAERSSAGVSFAAGRAS
jgi:hypothetical protein